MLSVLQRRGHWSQTITKEEGEKPGVVVREEDSHPRGRGFESRRILDASYYIYIEKKKNYKREKLCILYSNLMKIFLLLSLFILFSETNSEF
jgi:hypothetical protein